MTILGPGRDKDANRPGELADGTATSSCEGGPSNSPGWIADYSVEAGHGGPCSDISRDGQPP
jgi:hypothetical protein